LREVAPSLRNHLSKNQKKILENLAIKPNMTTKDLAEMIFGKIVAYKTKEYASVYRSLVSLEKQGLVEKVRVQPTWRRAVETVKE
jgi:DNA-binding MarR family transcriptional regulator